MKSIWIAAGLMVALAGALLPRAWAQSSRERERYDHCMSNNLGAGHDPVEYCKGWAPCDSCGPKPVRPPLRWCDGIAIYPSGNNGYFAHKREAPIFLDQAVPPGTTREQILAWLKEHLPGWTAIRSPERSWPEYVGFQKGQCTVKINPTYPITVSYGPFEPDRFPLIVNGGREIEMR